MKSSSLMHRCLSRQQVSLSLSQSIYHITWRTHTRGTIARKAKRKRRRKETRRCEPAAQLALLAMSSRSRSRNTVIIRWPTLYPYSNEVLLPFRYFRDDVEKIQETERDPVPIALSLEASIFLFRTVMRWVRMDGKTEAKEQFTNKWLILLFSKYP